MNETLVEPAIPNEELENFGAPEAELAFPMLDGILFPLVVANAEVVAPCPWLDNAEVSLTVALNNYYQPMTEEDASAIIADVYEFLANQVQQQEQEQDEQIEVLLSPEKQVEESKPESFPKEAPVSSAAIESETPLQEIELSVEEPPVAPGAPVTKPMIRPNEAVRTENPVVEEQHAQDKTAASTHRPIVQETQEAPATLDVPNIILEPSVTLPAVELYENDEPIMEVPEYLAEAVHEAAKIDSEEATETVAIQENELRETLADEFAPATFDEVAKNYEADECPELEVGEPDVEDEDWDTIDLTYQIPTIADADFEIAEIQSSEVIEDDIAFESLQASLVELVEYLEPDELDIIETIDEIVENIIGLTLTLEANDDEILEIIEQEIQQEVMMLLTEILNEPAFMRKAELIDLLTQVITQQSFLWEEVGVSEEEEEHEAVATRSIRALITIVQAVISMIQRTLAQAESIGKSVVGLCVAAVPSAA